MIKNKIQEILTEQGRKPDWLAKRYKQLTGRDMDYHCLLRIRKNEQQITLHQAVYFAKALQISDFRKVIHCKDV